jgi:exopolysaccharide production protein ExoY
MIVGALERLSAGAILLVVSPALLFVVAAVALLSKRPPLVTHRRVGLRGREIRILKIRSMWNADEVSGNWWHLIEHLPASSSVPDSKQDRDPRVTSAFASFCRKYSIDEWPQLWQVVTGTLALVGPRPLTQLELSRHYGGACTRLAAVKPGLIGLWQVRGRSRLTYPQRLELDLFMLDNWSVRLYIQILLASIPAVLSGRDAY